MLSHVKILGIEIKILKQGKYQIVTFCDALTCDSQKTQKVVTDWTVRASSSGRGKRFFLSAKCPNQLWSLLSFLFNGYQVLFREEKRPGRKVNHAHLSIFKGKNEWSYTSTSPICFHSVDRVISLRMTKIGVWST